MEGWTEWVVVKVKKREERGMRKKGEFSFRQRWGFVLFSQGEHV